MESFLADLKREVQCSLCNDTLIQPKLLQCFHTFCKACIRRNSESNILTCPECRSQTLLPGNDVDGLKPSLLHSRILEVIAFAESEKVCYVADNHSKASWWCCNCNRWLCDDCYNCHSMLISDHKAISLRDLTKEDLEFVLRRENNCSLHDQKISEFYCHSCQRLICIECLKVCRGHNTVELSAWSSMNKASVLENRTRLETAASERRQQMETLQEIVGETKRNGERAKEIITRTTQQVIADLQAQEQALIQQVNNRVENAEAIQRERQRSLNQTEAAMKYIDDVIEKGYYGNQSMIDHLEEWQSPVYVHTFSEDICKFEFVPSDDIESKTVTLGAVKDMKLHQRMEQYYFVQMNKIIDLKEQKQDAPIKGRDSPRPSGVPQTDETWTTVPGKTRNVNVEFKTLQDAKKLVKTENRWVRPSEQTKYLGEDEKKTQETIRKFRSILNKLTPQKFQTLIQQILDLDIDTPERLEEIINITFEKAINEPAFSVAFANMCRCLIPTKVKVGSKDGKDQTLTFRTILLNKCQKEFEREKNAEINIHEKMDELLKKGLTDEEMKLKKAELAQEELKSRRRTLGNIRFIGELYKLKMLTESIMHDCIIKLFERNDEEAYECLCKLLSTIGKDFDHQKAKPRMDQYFVKMNKIIDLKKTSATCRFMLQDVMDLRLNNWVPRRDENNPKTIDQIHKEVAEEEKMTTLMAS